MIYNKSIFRCLVLLAFIGAITTLYLFKGRLLRQELLSNQLGTVIILNGPSSVGKSSIQKKVQELFEQPYLRMGFDDLAFLPPRYISVDGPVFPANQGIWLDTIKQNNHQIVRIHYGEVGQKMIKGIHRTFSAFASAGNNIIVDYILYDRTWLSDLVEALKGYKVYFIGVNAPLSVIEEREKQRGNRLVGHSRSHYDTVHKDLMYDLEIDSSKFTPEELALIIKNFVAEHPNPRAFQNNR